MKKLVYAIILIIIMGNLPLVNGLVIEYTEENSVDWGGFWNKFKQHAYWELEYNDGSGWTPTEGLSIERTYPEENTQKFTLIFDALYAGDYRLTFAIDQSVRDYVSHPSEYVYEITYDNMTLVFDWSDAAAIPGINFNHGVYGGYFWFRISRDNVPAGAHVEIDPTIIVSYLEESYRLDLEDHHPSDSVYYSGYGQGFTAPAYDTILTNVTFKLYKSGSPTGNGSARLYAHTGTYGSSGRPTGLPLANSSLLDVSTLTTSSAEVTLNFTSGYVLEANTKYFIVFENPTSGTINNLNEVRMVHKNPGTHAGNAAYYKNSAWTAASNLDVYFKLYAYTPPTIDSHTGDTLFTQNVYGWQNFTITDLDLVADLTNVTMQVYTGDNNETFTLRWVQATNTFSEVSDTDNVCTLDAATSTRTNVDTNTDTISFYFMISGASTGNCDVNVTIFDDEGLNTTETYTETFVYTTYNWNPVATFMDEVFAYFGISGYMTAITTFISGITTYFTSSLTRIVTLVSLQFTVITEVWGFFIYWATELIGIVIDASTFIHEIAEDTQSTLSNGIGNIFNILPWDGLMDFVPIWAFITWITSIGERATKYSTSEFNILIQDANTAIMLLSYFFNVFTYIANTIIDRVSGLFDAII